MIYGTYGHGKNWQTIAAFETMSEARETLEYHAGPDDRVVIMPEKLTFRPGHTIAIELIKWCCEHDVTPSDAIREALSDMFGLEKPEMERGRPTKE